jgi:hypothetical protein
MSLASAFVPDATAFHVTKPNPSEDITLSWLQLTIQMSKNGSAVIAIEGGLESANTIHPKIKIYWPMRIDSVENRSYAANAVAEQIELQVNRTEGAKGLRTLEYSVITLTFPEGLQATSRGFAGDFGIQFVQRDFAQDRFADVWSRLLYCGHAKWEVGAYFYHEWESGEYQEVIRNKTMVDLNEGGFRAIVIVLPPGYKVREVSPGTARVDTTYAGYGLLREKIGADVQRISLEPDARPGGHDGRLSLRVVYDDFPAYLESVPLIYSIVISLITLVAGFVLRIWRENKQIRKRKFSEATDIGRTNLARSIPLAKTGEEAEHLSAVTHLGLRVETKSTAVWKWWILKHGPIKSYVDGETYDVAFKFRNLGSHDFAGGMARIMIKWQSGIFVVWAVTMPELNSGKDGYALFDDGRATHSGEVISSGFGTISCVDVRSRDQGTVTMTDLSGQIPYPSEIVIHSIPAKTWIDIYAKYSMIVAAAGLFIVALDRVITAVLWLLRTLGGT